MDEKNGFREGEVVSHGGWGLRGVIICLDTGEEDTVLVRFDEPTDHGDELDVETKYLTKVRGKSTRKGRS